MATLADSFLADLEELSDDAPEEQSSGEEQEEQDDDGVSVGLRRCRTGQGDGGGR